MNRLWKWLMSYLAMYEEHAEEEMEEHELLHSFGSLTIKYEGGEWGAVISDTPGDPGGKSYGPYQMSSAAGTVRKFVDQCQYKAFFNGLEVGTEAFDTQWIAQSEDRGFIIEQDMYMTKKYYRPAATYAAQQGFSMDDRAMKEVIFSIAVQHGGYKKIIKRARKRLQTRDIPAQIEALYTERRAYVQGLASLSSLIKHAIMKRYDMEQEDALSIYRHYS